MTEDPSMLKTVLDWMWLGIVALIGVVWKGQQIAIDKKADKEQVDRHQELFGKMFDKLDEHSREDREFHETIMRQTHAFHTEVLGKVSELQATTFRELAQKKDRNETDERRKK